MTLAERQGRLGNLAVARCEAELPERSTTGCCTKNGIGYFPMSCRQTKCLVTGRSPACPGQTLTWPGHSRLAEKRNGGQLRQVF